MAGFWRPETPTEIIANKIAAQITPPEPPMEEPTVLGSVVDTDQGWAILRDPTNPRGAGRFPWSPWYVLDVELWAAWGDLKNPRKLENPRQEPATAPQSDAQGSGSGIGRVSESEAVEGAPDAWRKRMRAFGGIL